MQKVCRSCHFVGKGKNSWFDGNIFFGLITVAIGIGVLVTGYFSFLSHTIKIIFGIFLIITGIYDIIKFYIGGPICPNCKKREMLNIDDPKAIELVKNLDLIVGQNPTQVTDNTPLDPPPPPSTSSESSTDPSSSPFQTPK